MLISAFEASSLPEGHGCNPSQLGGLESHFELFQDQYRRLETEQLSLACAVEEETTEEGIHGSYWGGSGPST